MLVRGPFAAVFFDMDGTLIDSEVLAERVVADFLNERGLGLPDGDLSQFHGVTWNDIARALTGLHPSLDVGELARELQAANHAALTHGLPPEIPGARNAVMAASRTIPTGVVSSSNRESVELVVKSMGVADSLSLTICAEDCQRYKPDPQPYQIAAERSGVDPKACLVFEDSLAGLTSAQRAGMRTVAILRGKSEGSREKARELADASIEDYNGLPADFFSLTEASA